MSASHTGVISSKVLNTAKPRQHDMNTKSAMQENHKRIIYSPKVSQAYLVNTETGSETQASHTCTGIINEQISYFQAFTVHNISPCKQATQAISILAICPN